MLSFSQIENKIIMTMRKLAIITIALLASAMVNAQDVKSGATVKTSASPQFVDATAVSILNKTSDKIK